MHTGMDDVCIDSFKKKIEKPAKFFEDFMLRAWIRPLSMYYKI